MSPNQALMIGAAAIAVFTMAVLLVPAMTSVTYETSVAGITDEREAEKPVETIPPIDTRPVVTHVPLPDQVKNIYMSACVAGTPDFRNDLVELIEETEVNSVIIDIKDFSGSIAFPVATTSAWYPAWQNADCGARDMKEFIALLHEKDIYVIGRITVFQDPFYTKQFPEFAVKRSDRKTVWKDYKGLSFVDVGARVYWDHVVELSRLSYNIGFDELNYDYVRYPSDGNMQDIAFTHSGSSSKSDNLEKFFMYLSEETQDPALYADVNHTNTGRATATPYMSADLFGFTTTNQDDLSIGQIIERAFPYFDFIAPMVYPSHYPDGSFGLGNPNEFPYQIVYNAMVGGVARAKATTTSQFAFAHERIGTSTPPLYKKEVYSGDNLRTWIQDFDYGGDYDAADVRAQFQASYDAGVDSWMIWAPSNRYTKAALKPAATTTSSTNQ